MYSLAHTSPHFHIILNIIFLSCTHRLFFHLNYLLSFFAFYNYMHMSRFYQNSKGATDRWQACVLVKKY